MRSQPPSPPITFPLSRFVFGFLKLLLSFSPFFQLRLPPYENSNEEMDLSYPGAGRQYHHSNLMWQDVHAIIKIPQLKWQLSTGPIPEVHPEAKLHLLCQTPFREVLPQKKIYN